MSVLLSRRSALLAASALPFSVPLLGSAVQAKAAMLGKSTSSFNRIKLGEFEVTSLLAGTRTVPDPHSIFGTNASMEAFTEAADTAFIPADKAQFFFTPTVVNTGSELILFDTGLAGEGITTALAAAGYKPEDVDVVVLTHMHGDHIGGLMTNGVPTFANARYVTGSTEHNFWSAQGNEGFDANVKPFNDKMTFVDDGGSAAAGITAMMAPGHTPGHMVWLLESAGQRLAITADTANHYIFSLAYPDWEVSFDNDKALAAASRKTVYGMIAADKIPFIGYHMPFPALGYVEAKDSGFRYVPASYQFMLDEG